MSVNVVVCVYVREWDVVGAFCTATSTSPVRLAVFFFDLCVWLMITVIVAICHVVFVCIVINIYFTLAIIIARKVVSA